MGRPEVSFKSNCLSYPILSYPIVADYFSSTPKTRQRRLRPHYDPFPHYPILSYPLSLKWIIIVPLERQQIT